MFWTAKVTSRGQITLPKGLRKYLGLGPGARVRFVVRDQRVELEPIEGDILSWYGALRAAGPAGDWSAVREAVRQAIAQEVVREGASS